MTRFWIAAAIGVALSAVAAIAPMWERDIPRNQRLTLAAAKIIAVLMSVFCIAFGSQWIAEQAGALFKDGMGLVAMGSLGVLVFLTWRRDFKSTDSLSDGRPIGSRISRFFWLVGAALTFAISVSVLVHPYIFARGLPDSEDSVTPDE